MPNTVINGVDLNWQLTGEAGDPLVLVHGSWGDHHGWDAIVPVLARSFRVLTYDRRGHSQSARPAGQGSVREDVADLGALIEHLDLAPAHILGSSFGGVIVLRLASERADLFRSLLVHEPPLFGLFDESATPGPLLAGLAQVRAALDLLEKGQIEAGARLFMETVAFGPGAWAQFPVELRNTFVFNAPTFLDEERDPESRTIDPLRLAGFSHPALLTQGDHSAPFFPVFMDELAAVLPTARRETIVGADHVPQVSLPEEYAQLVESFIRRPGS